MHIIGSNCSNFNCHWIKESLTSAAFLGDEESSTRLKLGSIYVRIMGLRFNRPGNRVLILVIGTWISSSKHFRFSDTVPVFLGKPITNILCLFGFQEAAKPLLKDSGA